MVAVGTSSFNWSFNKLFNKRYCYIIAYAMISLTSWKVSESCLNVGLNKENKISTLLKYPGDSPELKIKLHKINWTDGSC